MTGYDEQRLYLLNVDESTGTLTIDTAFHNEVGRPGFNFDNRKWPHGWQGSANPHGARVFQIGSIRIVWILG